MSAPVPDTTDLRSGAAIHDALLALLPLVGVWHGGGTGVVASSGEQFTYGQRITVSHDGRPFLAYESRSWLLDADGSVIRQAWRENGFWRAGPGQDDIELTVAANTGQALIFAGVAGDQRWDIATISAQHTPSAVGVDGERRLYALRGEELVYVTELAPAGGEFAPHLNGRLTRG